MRYVFYNTEFYRFVSRNYAFQHLRFYKNLT
jgi:hypothetical protein